MSDPVCLQRRLQSHRPPTWHQYNLRSSSATTLSSAHPSPTIPSPPLKCITPSLTSLPLSALPFDIHSYPATDLLKLLALLLTHIATTNDHLSTTNSSSGSSSDPPSSPLDPIDAPPLWYTLTTASQGAISTSAATLTFHARNVPTISVEAYLLRILKYCPTTNHVFLSLLVYFDRMSKLSEDSVGRTFVIDSFNIHRLVIAGVMVASKFFSDVFYTNSRYAKVGGLPLSELNQLELQFLLLSDFRLVISSTEMQYYAEQLILFSKLSTSTTPLSSLHLPPNGHHPIPNSNPTQPSQPHAAITAPLSTSPNASRPITSNFKKLHKETEGSIPHPGSNFTSASNLSFPGASKRPFDALGCVPPPVLPNIVNHPSAYHSQTSIPVPVYSHLPRNGSAHLSSSSLNSHSSPYLDPRSLPHYRSQPQLHSQPQQQQQHLNQRQHDNQRVVSSPSVSSSLSSSSTGHMDDHDPDTDTEDADTSTDAGTDAGTETDAGSETDEEPTIRAPPTVAGSVGSGASVGGGSVWGDETDEADERMASP